MNLPERFRRKALTYVTVRRRLLVFHEPDFPEVGLQVPGGTVEPGETVASALVRELAEETGRSDFEVGGSLGVDVYAYEKDGVRHVHERHFFNVIPDAEWPEHWSHADATPDLGGPLVRLEFLWLALDDPGLRLFAGLDAKFPALIALLGSSS